LQRPHTEELAAGLEVVEEQLCPLGDDGLFGGGRRCRGVGRGAGQDLAGVCQGRDVRHAVDYLQINANIGACWITTSLPSFETDGRKAGPRTRVVVSHLLVACQPALLHGRVDTAAVAGVGRVRQEQWRQRGGGELRVPATQYSGKWLVTIARTRAAAMPSCHGQLTCRSRAP